ncbi:SusC/RagA family TonB-linked outer membrane protein [Rufibacter latericius]|uniref:SusC/RagA family TonB-linked outer membrane protein n=1 Tax=Rufibacter latericius TaxID=2487040 RepID=A0A3M9MQM7_9BACT|nr:SusC/RagA family TonB-linked outer membrane protein [Rufibacter latericius]RNI27008.1 SusC/RagA family TonB-linked outer membrane protein [Rufibacter latericius]
MRIMLRLLLVALSLCIAQAGFAQSKTITGRVTSSEDNSAMPGVSVVVKGSSNGVSTDAEGRYSIQAAPGSVLVFSFIGMLPQERTIGVDNSINIALVSDSKALEEVVVTGFNIAQERKSINYAVQEVSGQALEESRQQNVVNALQGKVAGVNITSSGGGAGEGSSIVIRGGSSIDGDNQPLFVIDGIPVDNSSFQESTAPGAGSGFNGMLGRSVGASNRAGDINPDDIASITVLKGPAAAALYGLRAGNGAVIITTKKGVAGQTSITYNGLFSFDEVNRLPEVQQVYQQGTNGVYDATTRRSWGPRFQEGQPVYNNIEDFFQTGFKMNHNLSISGGSEKTSFYISANHLDQGGVVPETEYQKNSVRVSGTAKFNDKLSFDGSANYLQTSGQRALQGPGLFGGTGGFLVSIFNWPLNDNMSDWQNPDGSRRRLLESVTGDIDNPYFTVNKNPQTDRTDRIIGNVGITLDPTNWLKINYRIGTDVYTERTQSVRAPGTSLPNNQSGGLAISVNQFQQYTSNFVVTANKNITEKFGVGVVVGNTVEQTETKGVDYLGLIFQNPEFVGLNNTTNRSVIQRNSLRRLIGAFGRVSFDYDNFLFLELQGRNDWSSTLPVKNRSFAYGSASLGYVFTEHLPLSSGSFLKFGKLNVSYAQVGKDSPPYRVSSPLTNNTFLGGGFRNNFFGGNPELKPETKNSFETGLDFNFSKNNLRFNVTYYNDRTVDQIIAPRLSQASGFILQYVNGGTVENKGVEAILSGTAIQNGGFNWDVVANFSRNRSKVVSIPYPLTEIYQSDAWIVGFARGGVFQGGSLSGLSAMQYERAPDGQMIISATGYPTFVDQKFTYAGDRAPNYTLQITNTFNYNNLSLSFLTDIRKGGVVVNGNEATLVSTGLSTRTLDRYKKAIFPGVVAVTGADGKVSYVPNTREVELTESYYRNIMSVVGDDFIEDASWVRLRYVTLAYRLPKAAFGRIPFKNVEFNLTGRNLLLLTKYSGSDPETASAGAGVRGGGSGGFDYGSVPGTKGVDFGVKLSF